ncbi:hypothetical protein G5I_00567 [Acromyrmex echinatior]|uniref:Uncharacterized protein n=1 Tax=Acromyrmex echinatior TaxID=103372 RepID=F4W576_ACREC|nr:hypothetical protein G5I_00567 [Acromyrmex echinatior]
MTADTAMHTLLFAHLGPRRKRHFLSSWGSMSWTYGSIVRMAMCSAACWMSLADFYEAVMHKKERTEIVFNTIQDRILALNSIPDHRDGSVCSTIWVHPDKMSPGRRFRGVPKWSCGGAE